jgi:hypothetical protein
MRHASDDVRETLHALDVELSRETDTTLVMQTTSLVRKALALLRSALAHVHTAHKRENRR